VDHQACCGHSEGQAIYLAKINILVETLDSLNRAPYQRQDESFPRGAGIGKLRPSS
jgi:hypothetical protein